MSKFQECNTLEDLAALFQTKLDTVRQGLQLRDTARDPSVQSMMTSVGRGLSELDGVLTLMKAELLERKQALIKTEEMRKLTTSLQERVAHAQSNLPSRLPTKQAPERKHSANKENVEPIERVFSQVNISTVANRNNTKATSKASTKKAPSGSKTLQVPILDYLTVVDFESVPKYMKGRLTYDKVNSAVEDFNKAVSAKYSLLSTKRSAQTDFIKMKIVSYKEKETKDTKGVTFIDEGDLKESGVKLDSAWRSIVTILRHCGRIREIRGGGITRYAVCI